MKIFGRLRSKHTLSGAGLSLIAGIGLLPLQAFAKDGLPGIDTALGSAELMRVGGGLVIIVLFILVLSWLVKRLNRSNLGFSGPFQILACASLGAREKIMMVKVGDRFLLLGVAAGSINTLFDFGQNLPPGFTTDSKHAFSQMLKQVMGKS